MRYGAAGSVSRVGGGLRIALVSLLAAIAGVACGTEEAETVRSADAFVDSIGVNAHIPYDDTAYWTDYPVVREKLAELGVRHVRSGARMTGSEEYDRTVYERYRDLGTLGIEMNLVVDPVDRGFEEITPSDIEYIASNTGEALGSFEGPNEKDIQGGLTWAEDTRSYQQELYEAVNSNEATSEVPVLAPSLAFSENAGDLGNLGSHADYGNLHPYPGGEPPTAGLDDYNIPNAEIVSGGGPLIATETGYHTVLDAGGDAQPGVSEGAMGKYMPRLFLEYFNRDVERTYAYELMDLQPNPQNDNDQWNFGLLDNSGAEKPAYQALANMISVLEDPGPAFDPEPLDYVLRGSLNDVHQAVFQKRNGRSYLVLWQEVPSFNLETRQEVEVEEEPVTVSLAESAGEVVEYRPLHSEFPVERYTDTAEIEVGVPDHPLILEITPEDGPQ